MARLVSRLVVVALVLALVVTAGGCGASHTIEITRSRTTAPQPLKDVAVFVSLLRRGGDRGIYHGLKKALPGELSACGVASKVVAGMPENRDGNGEASPPAGPDAQLIIRSAYGEVRSVTTVDPYGNVLDEKAYKDTELDLWFELFDHKQNRVTWQAFAKLHMTDSGNVVGEDLARIIVARLRSDGVLRGCATLARP
jgi:hypothetical protein